MYKQNAKYLQCRCLDLSIFFMESTFQVSSYAVLDFRCFQSYYLPKLERVCHISIIMKGQGAGCGRPLRD